jgi:tetratricopeptide (TPR) repeat protein
MKRLAPILVAAAVIVLLLSYFLVIRVAADSVGIADTGRPADTPVVLKPGLHLHPVGAQLLTYSTLPVTVEGEALMTPAAGGEIPARFSVTARIDPDHVADLHKAIAGRRTDEFLKSQTDLMLREYASHADAVEALTPQFRSRAATEIAAALKKLGFAEVSLTVRPPDADTLLAAAQYLAPRREAWKIRQTVAEALGEPGGSGSWKLQTAMGLVNESEKLFTDAEKNYFDALAIDPSALPPMSELVNLYSTVKEWARLQRVLDAALTANPKSLQHINWMAMVLLKQDDLVGCERILKSGLELEPASPMLLANLGTLYMKMNRVDDALAAFQKAVEASPASQQAQFNMGSALAATGRFAEALPYLERAEQAGRPGVQLLGTLMIVNEKLGDKTKAAAYRARVKALEADKQAGKKPPPASKNPS